MRTLHSTNEENTEKGYKEDVIKKLNIYNPKPLAYL
jgi:hypothetical protein